MNCSQCDYPLDAPPRYRSGFKPSMTLCAECRYEQASPPERIPSIGPFCYGNGGRVIRSLKPFQPHDWQYYAT